jgi:hypothetical protein
MEPAALSLRESHAVVACTDVTTTAAFLGGLDFTERSVRGTDAVVGPPGLDGLAGAVRLVAADAPPARRQAYGRGPFAFDLYTTDVEASLELVRALGATHGPVGHVELGPLSMDQVLVHGPDGLDLVLIDANRRRASRLDASDAVHSEAHSMVCVVDSIDEALPFWRDEAGLSVVFDMPVTHPAIPQFMQLPDPDVEIRMAMVSDPAVTPMRFELFEYVDRPGAAFDGDPLRAGVVGPGWCVDDLGDALSSLPSADLLSRTAATARLRAPGGVVFELLSPPTGGQTRP